MPDTYYLPGQVHPDDDMLSATHLGATLRMRIANVRCIAALQLPLMLVEIGLVLEDIRGNRMWLRETDPQFHWLARRLDIAARLGPDWHHRVEAGEHLAATIEPQVAAPKSAS